MQLDHTLFQTIHNLSGQSKILDWVGVFLAQYLAYILIIITIIFLLFRLYKIFDWKIGLLTLLIIFLSRFVFVEIIRYFFYRPRPFLFYDFQPLISHDISASLPSGHSAFFFALAIAIYFSNKKLGWIFFACAFLIGLARIFVGVHYPIDILSGASVGILSGLIIYGIIKRKK